MQILEFHRPLRITVRRKLFLQKMVDSSAISSLTFELSMLGRFSRRGKMMYGEFHVKSFVVTPTFTKSDESWSVESTLVVFDSLQILNNSDNVFKIITS